MTNTFAKTYVKMKMARKWKSGKEDTNEGPNMERRESAVKWSDEVATEEDSGEYYMMFDSVSRETFEKMSLH